MDLNVPDLSLEMTAVLLLYVLLVGPPQDENLTHKRYSLMQAPAKTFDWKTGVLVDGTAYRRSLQQIPATVEVQPLLFRVPLDELNEPTYLLFLRKVKVHTDEQSHCLRMPTINATKMKDLVAVILDNSTPPSRTY